MRGEGDSAEELDERSAFIGREILKEIEGRLGFLNDVGLDYLTLDRKANTLSGGESQRIRFATQIGSRLTGVMYVLDEPSIGLHQRDNEETTINSKRTLRSWKHIACGRTRRGHTSASRLAV